MKFKDLITYVPKRKPPANFIDFTDTENNSFKIISRAPNKNGRVQWNVQCKICGKYCVKEASNLNRDKSCGCIKNVSIGKALRKDLTGQKFGNLTALKYTGRSNKSQNAIWLCLCDCGNTCEVASNNLTSLHTCSCGCLTSSIGADNISKILKQNQILFITEYPVYNLEGEDNSHPYRFDFLIVDNNKSPLRLIEYDGIQHYVETWGKWKEKINLTEQQRRDKVKNEYALFHNIPLVRIPYWERDNITLDMIMGDQYLVKNQ